MGADLALAFAPVTRASKEELIKRIDLEIEKGPDFVEWMQDYFFDETMTKDDIRNALIEALDMVVFSDYRRDLAVVNFGDDAYYATGGMTWGDDPTEAFKYVQLLSNSGITDDVDWLDKIKDLNDDTPTNTEPYCNRDGRVCTYHGDCRARNKKNGTW